MAKKLVFILLCLFVVVGFGEYLKPQTFNTVTPIVAASDTVYIKITEPHTVLFFDIAVESGAATVTIVGNYKPYDIVWTTAAGTSTYLFVHPLETVFYAKKEYITITKEGTFTKFNIYVLETYW